MTMGMAFTIAACSVYAAFWIRFFMHLLVWWKAVRRLPRLHVPAGPSRTASFLFLVRDIFLFWRLLMVNPALWIGEWVFHLSFLLVVLRHLRYFLNPVPQWVWELQLPGLIAGYVLPFALIYILIVRLASKKEKFSSRANLFLLCLLLLIVTMGLSMRWVLTPNLVDVKLFALGIMTLHPASFPDSMLFLLHFVLVLVFVLLVPTHIIAAPFVMYEARKRDLGLKAVMHDENKEE